MSPSEPSFSITPPPPEHPYKPHLHRLSCLIRPLPGAALLSQEPFITPSDTSSINLIPILQPRTLSSAITSLNTTHASLLTLAASRYDTHCAFNAHFSDVFSRHLGDGVEFKHERLLPEINKKVVKASGELVEFEEKMLRGLEKAKGKVLGFPVEGGEEEMRVWEEELKGVRDEVGELAGQGSVFLKRSGEFVKLVRMAKKLK